METVLKKMDNENLALNFQATGELVGTSPFRIRGQSKIYQNRSDTKFKPTEIA